jgi:predicted double-glycine peptidase
MQKITFDKYGRIKKIFGLPAWANLLIFSVAFAGVYYATRTWLRVYAVNQVLIQDDKWSKDGVLMQTTRFTCVPASIVMLLKDQGIDSDTYEIVTLTKTNTEGTDPAEILAVGKHFGFSVITERMDFNRFMKRNLPAVVTFTWQNEFHAVYVRPDKEHNVLDVKDPSMGRLYFKEDQVKDYFGSDEWDCYLFEKIKKQ